MPLKTRRMPQILPHKLGQDLAELTRPGNALGPLLGLSIGRFASGYGGWHGYVISLVILLLIHSAATVQNDIEDIDIDKTNKRHTALTDGTVTIQQAQTYFWVMSYGALLLCLLSPARRVTLLFVAMFFIISWLYNKAPFYLSRRPISSIICMGLSYGGLPMAFGYVSEGAPVSGKMLTFAVAWFILRVSTSIMKDYKDANGDKLHGKQTFFLKYGRRTTASVSLLSGSLGYLAAIILTSGMSAGKWKYVSAFLLLLLTGKILSVRFRLLKADTKTSAKVFVETFRLQSFFDLAVLACLIAF